MSSLYKEEIKKLAQLASIGKKLANSDATVVLKNPMCGDEVTVTINTKDQLEVGYSVRGCVICQAACAKMNEIVEKNNQKKDLINIVEQVTSMFSTQNIPVQMELFAPVSKHKSRQECVLLPFKAIMQLLSK